MDARGAGGAIGALHAAFGKLDLASKTLLAALSLYAALGVAGTVVSQRALRARLHDELAHQTGVLALAAAERVSERLERESDADLDPLIADIRALDESIGYVLVTGRDGALLGHSFPWEPPASLARAVDAADGADGWGARDVEVDGTRYLDVAAPVRVGSRGAAVLQLGVDLRRVDRFVHGWNTMLLIVLGGLALLGAVGARQVFRRIARPIAELTRLADAVSIGDLDVRFDFGLPVRCWEIKGCERGDCAAHGNTAVQCWFVDGTPCEGYEPNFPAKLVGCRTCEVYRAHKGDEIVQLADSLRHMTHELGRHQLELERAARFQGRLIRNSFDGIIATDETDTVRVFNRVAQALTGYGEEEVVDRMSWYELFATQMCDALDAPLFHDGTRVIFGFYRREIALYARDGSSVDVLASGISMLEDGTEIGKVFFFKDMREIKQLREDLVRSERMAATGQTVASISHSIKNILDGLRGGAYIYKRGVRIEDPSVRSEGWEMVERNIGLISELVADLLNYARPRTPQLRPVDPATVVDDVVSTLRPRADARGVELRAEHDPGAAPSDLDTHAMHQCLANLVSNAIDAASDVDDGCVVVSTRTRGDSLVIRVADNGAGVAGEVADGLFSAMVSTKGSKGTGLGLLVVRKIVDEHAGTVELVPSEGPGAAFEITVPRRADPRSRRSA